MLLDDVVTSGCSLRACKFLLLNAGAGSVQALALGATESEMPVFQPKKPPSDFRDADNLETAAEARTED